MNIQPTSNNVFIKPIKEELINGLVHLESSSKVAHMGKEVLKGTVVACGQGLYTKTGTLVPLDTTPGDKVLYMNHDIYNKTTYNGEEVIIMRSNQIIAILD